MTFLLFAATALAQDAPEAPAAEEADVAASAPDQDGARRRRGTAAIVGLETVKDSFGTSLSAPMGGVDLRFGTQINDLLAVYVPLHLSLGAFSGLGTVSGIPAGLTGTLAATVVVDATFADRFFVGGGGGIGILNNPTGPALHLRAGGYPLVNRASDSNRRKGMAVALDLRVIYAKGLTGTFPTLSIGYESF